MRDYNPAKNPSRQEWLALDDDQRVDLVTHFHTKIGDIGEHQSSHALIHTVLETQIAENTPGVRDAIGRLRKQGLNRHDAIHALGTVLAEHMHNLAHSNYSDDEEPTQIYLEKISAFNASDWYSDDEI